MSMAKSVLARKRDQERLVREQENYLRDDFKTSSVVRWEQRTSIRIEKQDVLDRAKRLAEGDAQNLNKRRMRIRDLYENEMQEWKVMLESSRHVSIEERMEHIRAKATRLQEKREREREEFVKKCYDRQWRDGCDEIRALDAKAITDQVMNDRKRALSCQKNKLLEVSEDVKNSEEVKQRMNESEQKEKQEHAERQKKNSDMKIALDKQVESLRIKNESLRAERRREEINQLELWKEEDSRIREKELMAIREAHACGKEILVENSMRHKKREHDKALEKYQDIVMLNNALDREQEELQKEMTQKMQGREIAQEYLRFLKDQAIEDEKDNTRVDIIRDIEMEKIRAKRDADLKAQDERRQALMSDVNLARIEQIKHKEMKRKNEKELLVQQVTADLAKLRKQEEVEQDEAERKKKETVENMLVNKEAIEQHSKLMAQEKQEKFLLQNKILEEEQNYQERLKSEAGNIKTHFPRQGLELFHH